MTRKCTLTALCDDLRGWAPQVVKIPVASVLKGASIQQVIGCDAEQFHGTGTLRERKLYSFSGPAGAGPVHSQNLGRGDG